MRILALAMALALISTFAGCFGTTGDNSVSQNTTASSEEMPSSSFDKDHFDPSHYVDLGDYEGIEIIVDGLCVYVGEVLVDIPYRDETSGTEWTLRYYYSQVHPDEDKANWTVPADEEVTRMGISGITTFPELKDYVFQKLNENDEITSFMRIGDAVMEQIVADSAFENIPEDVIMACEGIYTDYLVEMLASYNEIGEIPQTQEDENCAYKVLAAMAVAQETGIGMDAFDYEAVLKYLVES